MPAITKANLIALANALVEARHAVEDLNILTAEQAEAIHRMYCKEIALVCSAGNSRFDRGKFLEAAGS